MSEKALKKQRVTVAETATSYAVAGASVERAKEKSCAGEESVLDSTVVFALDEADAGCVTSTEKLVCVAANCGGDGVESNATRLLRSRARAPY